MAIRTTLLKQRRVIVALLLGAVPTAKAALLSWKNMEGVANMGRLLFLKKKVATYGGDDYVMRNYKTRSF